MSFYSIFFYLIKIIIKVRSTCTWVGGPSFASGTVIVVISSGCAGVSDGCFMFICNLLLSNKAVV